MKRASSSIYALALMSSSLILGCSPLDEVSVDKEKRTLPNYQINLLGPGERGNFFTVTPGDDLRGMCFDGEIAGVYGFGKFLDDTSKPINLYVYFTRRHSPQQDRDAIRSLVPGVETTVNLDIGGCKSGYYDPSKRYTTIYGRVTVAE